LLGCVAVAIITAASIAVLPSLTMSLVSATTAIRGDAFNAAIPSQNEQPSCVTLAPPSSVEVMSHDAV